MTVEDIQGELVVGKNLKINERAGKSTSSLVKSIFENQSKSCSTQEMNFKIGHKKTSIELGVKAKS